MNVFKKFLFSGFLFLIVLLSGCTGAETSTPTASPTMTAIPTAIAPPPMATATAAPTATASPTNTPESGAQAAPSGDRAAFVSETYPDNSVLEGGESFTKAFELRNAGNETWTTDYALVRDETNPAGETLGAGDRLALPQAVGPGETLTLELPLTAPEDPGTYTVYWTLRDANGAVVPVDGVQRIWATIRVCADGQDCSAPVVAAGGPSAGGVSLTYEGVTHEGGMIFINYCVSVDNPGPILEYPTPTNVSLIIDGKEIISSERGSDDLNPGYSCVIERPAVTSETLNQAGSVILRVGKVQGVPVGDMDAICESVKPALKDQYPGLDFQCNYDSGNYYTGLRLPTGMSADEAHQIIVDALHGAIYGTWDLTIK